MPDTTQTQAEAECTELDDHLLYALEGPFARDNYDEIREAIAPALAAIRRHAAAEALRAQADRLSKIGRDYMAQVATTERGSVTRASLIVNSRQAHACATRIRQAAQNTIEEGWEHACAAEFPATREDPGYGCETPVENEGDYCPRHEAGDDD